MKALAISFGLFIATIFAFNDSAAQKTKYTTQGGWTLGIGGGYAYQKSDIANSRGFGFDLTIGSQLYQKENAFLSVDWKFRFLGGRNTAFDHRINPDDTYSNIRYRFLSYDLELGLTLNRLRERTGIVLTGFAGIGLTNGHTFSDLYDASGNLYGFSSIDPNRDSKLVYEDLVALSDGEFETSHVNKVAILPTAGLFLGYQLSGSLTIGLEYKSNFYLTEDNGAFGITLDNKAISGSGIDRNNYVSLGLRWRFRGGASSRGASTSYSSDVSSNYGNTTTNTYVAPVSSPHPSVHITEPSTETYHTVSPNHTIRATINNVSGPDNISFSRNGYPVNTFTYNVNTKTFVSNVMLQEGENSFRIEAANQNSTAEDQVTISLEGPPEEALPAPFVAFTSPSGDQYTSSADWVEVSASVKNIISKEDIQFTLNGINAPFEFYPYSGLLTSSVRRTVEPNNLLIRASNESGSAQDQLTIHFSDPALVAPPSVRIIDPLYPVEVRNDRFPLNAQTQNVFSWQDIDLIINGLRVDNFAFNADGMLSVDLLLYKGVNTIEILARNEAGMASDRTSITYIEPVYIEPVYIEPVNREPVSRRYPPAIQIISPSSYPFRTFEPYEDLQATVMNVHSKENIIVSVNGTGTRNFNFNNSSKELITRVPLREGENVLTIHARNESGEDMKEQVFIKESRPCPLPQIRLIDPAEGQISTKNQSYELRAEVRNITNSKQLSLSVNGKTVSYSLNKNLISSSVPLTRGNNTLSLRAENECGEDNASTKITYKPTVVRVPCTPPSVSFKLTEVNRKDATHELRGSVSDVENKSEISLTLNGQANKGFQFIPSTGELNAKFKLSPGSHTIVVTVNNDCGTDNQGTTVTVKDPCSPPLVSFKLTEVNREDATHELSGSVSGIKNKTGISLTVNGQADNGFQFVPSTGELNAKFKLAPGSHTIVVTANNECGTNTKSESVTVKTEDEDDDEDEDEDEEEEEQEACGIRINPGNSDWQFCLVTPSGTFSRESLTNSNFSYSGSASSLFFKPIGGGGSAMVNGQPYPVNSGQYYLFTGSLNVSVSTSHPGAMGHWSVCISTNRAPISGNGNNRPKSPCEAENSESDKGNLNDKRNNNNNGKDNSNNSNNDKSNNDKSNNGSNDNSNNGSVKSTNAGSGTTTNSRSNRGSVNQTIYRPGSGTTNRTNTVSNSRSNNANNSRSVTRTNYRSDDKTKSTGSTATRSARTTKDTTNTRTNNRSTSRTTSRSSGRTER